MIFFVGDHIDDQVAVGGNSGGGKRSFRSKRFSRNLDPARGEPGSGNIVIIVIIIIMIIIVINKLK